MMPGQSPDDRGSADRYYGRRRNPQKWLDQLGLVIIPLTDPEEIAEYNHAYHTETDRKDWGDPE